MRCTLAGKAKTRVQKIQKRTLPLSILCFCPLFLSKWTFMHVYIFAETRGDIFYATELLGFRRVCACATVFWRLYLCKKISLVCLFVCLLPASCLDSCKRILLLHQPVGESQVWRPPRTPEWRRRRRRRTPVLRCFQSAGPTCSLQKPTKKSESMWRQKSKIRTAKAVPFRNIVSSWFF